jgi:hypothetical protein
MGRISDIVSPRRAGEPPIFTTDARPERRLTARKRGFYHPRAAAKRGGRCNPGTIAPLQSARKVRASGSARRARLQTGRVIPGVHSMTIEAFSPALKPVAIPVRQLLPWVVFGGLLALLAIYFVGVEEGATSLISGMYVHEFVHDGRHLLGFPCH